MAEQYQPPFTITPMILNLVSDISVAISKISIKEMNANLRLRKINRIRTVQGSLAIEGNKLTEEQITVILDGKRVVAPPREIKEARNAIEAYNRLDDWTPHNESDLLQAHGILMKELKDDAGRYRQGSVGVIAGDKVAHMAPPAKRVPKLMGDLMNWLEKTEYHPLVTASVFHYEFEFIHPFTDGNGRMGRLWQTLILSRWQPVFSILPVESMVYANQQDYYQALRDSTKATDSAPFIEFMLTVIHHTLQGQITPQVSQQVTPQVKQLLQVLKGEMTAAELREALNLKDRESFRQRWLLPALEQGLIEMTIPSKPNSRMQKYRKVAR